MRIRLTAKLSHNVPLFLRAHEAAEIAGLQAAGQVIVNHVKRGLRGGYTSGEFVTGNVINSVRMTEPERDRQGRWVIRIGSELLYAVFWELGHHNIFTRRYERVPVWVPAMVNYREEARAAYVRVYHRVMRERTGGATLVSIGAGMR